MMHVSFSTLGCPAMQFDESLDMAEALGYDGVEMRGVGNTIEAPDLAAFAPEQQGRTLAKLAEKGLKIPILTSACYLHLPERREKTLHMARRDADTARMLGVRYIRVLGDRAPSPGGGVDDGLVRELLAEVADYAAKQGVGVLIETNGVYADSARL